MTLGAYSEIDGVLCFILVFGALGLRLLMINGASILYNIIVLVAVYNKNRFFKPGTVIF